METFKNKMSVKIRKLRRTQNMDERISRIFLKGFQAIYYYMSKNQKLIESLATKWIILLNTSKPKFDETIFNETIITLSKYIIKISILECNTVPFLSIFVHEFFWIMLYLPDICKERIFYEHKKEVFEVIKAIGSCGLYYVQTTFTEMIFKFYSACSVNGGYDLLKEMFEKLQVDESIIKLFTAIKLEVFDLNCRTFLNALNRAKKICNIFSISAIEIYIGHVQVKPPRFKNEIIPFWVDFSFSALQFSFYSDPLNENIIDRSWPLMTINIDIIDDINFLIVESELVFVVSLSDSIEISEESYSNFFNSAREVTLKFPINNDAKLLKKNFMSLFKTVKQKSIYETSTPKQSNKNQATIQINPESKTKRTRMTIIKDVSISDTDFAETEQLNQKLVKDTENIVKLNSMPSYSEISSFNNSTFSKKCYDNIPLSENSVKQNSVVEYNEQIMNNNEYSANLPDLNIIFNSNDIYNKENQPQIQNEKLLNVDRISSKELEVNQVQSNPTKRKIRNNKNKIASDLAADKIQQTGNKRKVKTTIPKIQTKTQTEKKRKINKGYQKLINRVKPLQTKKNPKHNIDNSPDNSYENIINTLNASSQLFYPTTIVESYEGSKRDQPGRSKIVKFLKDITNPINNDIYDIRNIRNDNIPIKKLKSTKRIISNNISPNTPNSENETIYSPILNKETDNKLVSYSYRRYRFNTETKLDYATDLKKVQVNDDLPKPSAQRQSSRITKKPKRYISSSDESIHLHYSSDPPIKLEDTKDNKKEEAILPKQIVKNPSKQCGKTINIQVVPEIDNDISMSDCRENEDNSMHNQFPVVVDVHNNNSSSNQNDENLENIHCVASEQTSQQYQTELVTCPDYNFENSVNSTANTPFKERCIEMSNLISYIQHTNATEPQSNQNLEASESNSPSNAAVSIINRNESSNTVNTIQECLILPLQNFTTHGPEKDIEQLTINFKASLKKFRESYHRSLLDCAKTISEEKSSVRGESQSVLHYKSHVEKLENEICKINKGLKLYRENHLHCRESMQHILLESIASVKEDMKNLRNSETQKLTEAFANITLECSELESTIWNNFIENFISNIENCLKNFVCQNI